MEAVSRTRSPGSQTVPFLAGPAKSLRDVDKRLLCWAAVWMGCAYLLWLFLRGEYGEYDARALLVLALGFAPWIIRSAYDYRTGLLLTFVATPFFVAPPIPHWFTQGFGDLFAVAAVTGFLLRAKGNGSRRLLRHLWRKEYVWLVLILVSGVVSLIPVLRNETDIGPYGIEYGLSELAGYFLAFSYVGLLVAEVRSRGDLNSAFFSAGLSVFIVILYGLLSIGFTIECVGGYYGSSFLSPNQGVGSSFVSPNSFVSFSVLAAPFLMALYARSSGAPRVLLLAAFLCLVFMVQASLSRAGLIVLAVLLFGWMQVTRWRRGTRALTALFAALLPLTVLVWWYPSCACEDAPPWACAPWYVAKQMLGIDEQSKAEAAVKQDVDRTSGSKQEAIANAEFYSNSYGVRDPESRVVPTIEGVSDEGGGTHYGGKDIEATHESQSEPGARLTMHEKDGPSTISVVESVVSGAMETRIIPKGAVDNTRIALALGAYTIWQHHWLIGVGIGQLENYLVVGGRRYKAHNMYLTTLAEQGVVGFAAWLGWLAALVMALLRGRRHLFDLRHPLPYLAVAFVGTCVVSLFIDQHRAIWMWQLFALILATRKIEVLEDGSGAVRA